MRAKKKTPRGAIDFFAFFSFDCRSRSTFCVADDADARASSGQIGIVDGGGGGGDCGGGGASGRLIEGDDGGTRGAARRVASGARGRWRAIGAAKCGDLKRAGGDGDSSNRPHLRPAPKIQQPPPLSACLHSLHQATSLIVEAPPMFVNENARYAADDDDDVMEVVCIGGGDGDGGRVLWSMNDDEDDSGHATTSYSSNSWPSTSVSRDIVTILVGARTCTHARARV